MEKLPIDFSALARDCALMFTETEGYMAEEHSDIVYNYDIVEECDDYVDAVEDLKSALEVATGDLFNVDGVLYAVIHLQEMYIKFKEPIVKFCDENNYEIVYTVHDSVNGLSYFKVED